MKDYFDSLLNATDPNTVLGMIDQANSINLSREFVIKDIGVSSRVLNHWAGQGLIPIEVREKNQKYNFNFLEWIWLNIVKELRDYGFSLDKIKIICHFLLVQIDYSEMIRSASKEQKEKLLDRVNEIEFPNKEEKEKFKEALKKNIHNIESNKINYSNNILSQMIVEFLFYRRDVRLLIDIEGKVVPYTDNDQGYHNVMMDSIEFDKDSFISISLLKFFKKFIQNPKHLDFIRANKFLNENELHLLSIIRSGAAKSITIRFKNQQPFMLEVTSERKIQLEARLSEILLNRGYQDISISTENGNIAFSLVTTKEKLK